jgi:hypothetical protein
VTRFVYSNQPAEISRIEARVVDASDGNNGKSLAELALDTNYEPEGQKQGAELVLQGIIQNRSLISVFDRFSQELQRQDFWPLRGYMSLTSAVLSLSGNRKIGLS